MAKAGEGESLAVGADETGGYHSVSGSTIGVQDEAVASSVLFMAPGMKHRCPAGYGNLTPWVQKLFFTHTYYVYIYSFLMFVLLFYKGYALEYPDFRRWFDMVMALTIPAVQHCRFFFGHWGCELGLWLDLSLFLTLCSLVNFMLLYFLYSQAYIMQMDSTLMCVAIMLVAVEGMCGTINILQTLKTQTISGSRMVIMVGSVFLFLASLGVSALQSLSPHQEMFVSPMRTVIATL
mmetsp:Transcript_33100/g.87520  ORF Transcript_33100/g.87520 Transcript_33100/m.87520 type:complete len:235 (-) Transcript_33100:44-748(-)